MYGYNEIMMIPVCFTVSAGWFYDMRIIIVVRVFSYNLPNLATAFS